MSEPANKCVCGHPESDHIDERPFVCIHRRDFNTDPVCPCHEFRRVLPWPDSEGWWWWDKHGIVECVAWPNELRVCYHGASGTQSAWQSNYGRELRFVRVTEPNPFTDPGEPR